MVFENVLVEQDGAVLTVTVNRPRVLNALNARTLEELDAVFADAGARDDVRVVVLTGAGEKSFVAGADINELAVLTRAGGREAAGRGQALLDRIGRPGKPV